MVTRSCRGISRSGFTPVRVLHVYKAYLPENFTGVPRVIWEISECLASKGVKSDVLCLARAPSRHPVKTGSHFTHQVRQMLEIASTGLSFSVLGKFSSLLRSADVVHYHFPWPLADLMHVAIRPEIPSLVTYHSDVVNQRYLLHLYRPLMHRFLRSVDHVVATSPQYVSTSSVLQAYAEKASVIPIGLREREEPPFSLVTKWRELVGKDFFLFVGAPRYYKGVPFLLDAASASGLPVVLIGDGELPWKFRRSIPGNVKVIGRVSDADREALLSLCRAFVLPSHLRSEAFGVALLEAARASRAMISCEIGTGTSYVNVNGETGLIVAPRDADGLAKAMSSLACDPDLAARLGRQARIRFESLFRAEKMGEAYLKIYRMLRGRRGSQAGGRQFSGGSEVFSLRDHAARASAGDVDSAA